MSKELFYIGSSPFDEDCAQTVSPDFAERNHRECAAYALQLARAYGEPPEGAYLAIKRENHDFGIYREVVIYFDPESEVQQEYASRVEEGLAKWDRKSAEVLGLNLEDYPE